MNWSTELPPTTLAETTLFVACGNGEIRTAKGSELSRDLYGLSWVAWSE